MVNLGKVMMYGMTVGVIRWDETRDIALFEYDRDFAKRGIEPSPLMMPVTPGRVYSFGTLSRDTFSGLPGMLADSLPDTYGRALFDKWLSLTGRTVGNPLESLCFLGRRCMGALEFEPAIETGVDTNRIIEVSALVEVAKSALGEKSEFRTNMDEDRKSAISQILRLGTSAGGQRAKAIIAYNKATGEVRSGQTDAPAGFEHYIIKLDGVKSEAGLKSTENYGRLEYSFYRLARKCGIDMSECSLIEENGRAHFLTKRFDRIGNSKVHMQTLCGIAHYDFHLLHAYSYEQAFGVMRALRLTYGEAREMFRRMVFNVVVRNQDDHTKNISYLMDESGKWRLSPAYDMGYAYNPAGKWTATHQMSVNGRFDGINRADLMACAAKNSISDAVDIIDEVCEAVSTWPALALDCGVPRTVIDQIVPNLSVDI